MFDFYPGLSHIDVTSHKKFSEGKQAHVGMEASKTNQTRWESMTPQHFHTIPTSCAISPPLTQICYVFASCVQRRVVEGSGVGIVVGVWCILMCMESELYGVLPYAMV